MDHNVRDSDEEEPGCIVAGEESVKVDGESVKAGRKEGCRVSDTVPASERADCSWVGEDSEAPGARSCYAVVARSSSVLEDRESETVGEEVDDVAEGGHCSCAVVAPDDRRGRNNRYLTCCFCWFDFLRLGRFDSS